MPDPKQAGERAALAAQHARDWMEAYGIRTEPYTRSGGDHPMMDTLPEAMLAFAAALRDREAGGRGGEPDGRDPQGVGLLPTAEPQSVSALPDGDPSRTLLGERVLIQCVESRLYWRATNNGVTWDINEAHVYSQLEGEKLIRHDEDVLRLVAAPALGTEAGTAETSGSARSAKARPVRATPLPTDPTPGHGPAAGEEDC